MSRELAQAPFLRSLRRLRAAFWRRRAAHWLVRTLWLALLVPAVCMAGYLWLGWQVQWQYWVYPMLVIVLLSIVWAMRPISLKKIAYRLDERLGFRNQLVTAFEVSHAENNVDNLVVQRLLQEAVRVVVNLRREIRLFGRNFWLEMQALVGVLVLLGAMLLLDALNPRLPNATLVDLPAPLAEPRADEVIPPNPELFPPPFPPEIQVQNLSSEQLQQALEALADALRDQAITRATADALDQGDLAEAAESLRRLADQLAELSEESRAELGESLQEAADNIDDNAPGLTDPLQSGSEALSADDLRQAGQALEELAEALDSLSEAPQETAQAPESAETQPGENSEGDSSEAEPSETDESQPPAETETQGGGDGASEGDEGGEGSDQPTEEERLAVEGQPLELEADPEAEELEEQVLQPAELEAEAGDERTDDSPFARGSANTATDLGPDPLTYPWDKREIIRRYFTP